MLDRYTLHNPRLRLRVHTFRGGALDGAWPHIPVAHLAFETDAHFSTVGCHVIPTGDASAR